MINMEELAHDYIRIDALFWLLFHINVPFNAYSQRPVANKQQAFFIAVSVVGRKNCLSSKSFAVSGIQYT